jgi:hypothetical protein
MNGLKKVVAADVALPDTVLGNRFSIEEEKAMIADPGEVVDPGDVVDPSENHDLISIYWL